MERFTFVGAQGHPLAARLDRPEGPHLATAVFAHCFSCSKDIAAARRISQRLAMMGIAVLRFDFTGLGHSEGEFENTTFTSNVGDIEAAAAHLAEIGMTPSLLIGHSLGGAAVLKAAGRIDSVKAVATLAAPFDPGHVTHNFHDALPRIAADGAAEVDLGGRPFRIGQDFVRDAIETDLSVEIASLRRALLILHAPLDDVVSIENATAIFTAARHPKSFVTLDDADHLLSRAEDAEYAAEVIAAWAGRYLDLRPPAPPPGAPEGVVRSSEADPAGFLQDINAGPHHYIQADEPAAYGGTDRGMSPYGLLSAALASCTSMTIRMYARRKGWPLEHVSVEVTHDKVHAQDSDLTGPNRIDRFERRVRLDGALDAEQRARLMDIADRCPVHKTLEAGAKVVTREVPAK
ncbi:bifunctional alpha/beta hydrolase/OsmC family protein [Aliiruegeria sabulilitoris]|uniref:bifunctional alpha/beta hydrolase/OsmC family protein n=1 Tax=Aliiruegeria sabulilitoris TaxID=1510458 RepID=UPI0008365A2E|nr:bifunctional alpha/beta hydrolase/OsmC family protein [Aliiruegeria sabulilitoris]NDR57186.1 OsmC family protein [Pseudoruegeria sp. M32A2M]